MNWLTLIFGVIQAIRLVRQILDLLNGHKDQGEHEKVLMEILHAWRDHQDKAKLIADLKGLKNQLIH